MGTTDSSPQVMMKSLDEMLTLLTTTVCASIADIDYASVSIRYGRDDLDTLGATDPRALKADALQYELREGPCLDALRVAGTVGVVRSQDTGIMQVEIACQNNFIDWHRRSVYLRLNGSDCPRVAGTA